MNVVFSRFEDYAAPFKARLVNKLQYSPDLLKEMCNEISVDESYNMCASTREAPVTCEIIYFAPDLNLKKKKSNKYGVLKHSNFLWIPFDFTSNLPTCHLAGT